MQLVSDQSQRANGSESRKEKVHADIENYIFERFSLGFVVYPHLNYQLRSVHVAAFTQFAHVCPLPVRPLRASEGVYPPQVVPVVHMKDQGDDRHSPNRPPFDDLVQEVLCWGARAATLQR